MRSFLTSLAVLVLAAPAAVAGPFPLEEGKTLSGLRLPTLSDGKLRSLDDFRGKKTVLHVFASW